MSENKTFVNEERLRARKKVVYDIFYSGYKAEAKEDPQAFLDSYFPGHDATPDLTKFEGKKSERYVSNKKLSPQKTAGLMVTFSPEEGVVSVPEMVTLITKLIKPGKGVIESYACIEQRGLLEEEMGIGVHFHALILLRKDEKMGEPGMQVNRIVRLLEKFRTKTDHFLDIKRVSDEKIDDKISYIMGRKDDADKLNKVEIDRVWRDTLSLPHYWNL